jgi:hypothetical protein
MVFLTAMEYADGLMEEYIMENSNRLRVMVTDTRERQMVIFIAENGRMTLDGERESVKKTDNYTLLNTKKASALAKVNYRRLLSRNECY